MSDFAEDLLQAADHLCTRRRGQKGPIKAAFLRRSLSTSYYAIFHFCLDEAASRLVDRAAPFAREDASCTARSPTAD